MGLPVLIGRNNSDGAIEAYERGFQLKGGDRSGQCLESANDEMSEIGDPFVSFGEDTTYGCSKRMNLANLQAYCENADGVKNLPLF